MHLRKALLACSLPVPQLLLYTGPDGIQSWNVDLMAWARGSHSSRSRSELGECCLAESSGAWETWNIFWGKEGPLAERMSVLWGAGGVWPVDGQRGLLPRMKLRAAAPLPGLRTALFSLAVQILGTLLRSCSLCRLLSLGPLSVSPSSQLLAVCLFLWLAFQAVGK